MVAMFGGPLETTRYIPQSGGAKTSATPAAKCLPSARFEARSLAAQRLLLRSSGTRRRVVVPRSTRERNAPCKTTFCYLP